MRKFCISFIVLSLITSLVAVLNDDEPIRTLPDLQAPYTDSFIMPIREGRQDTLWAQYPNPGTASSVACQRDTVYPFDAWALDDVIPPAADGDYEVEEVVTWWACFNGFTSWTLVSDIHFQVYEDSGLGYAFPKIMPSQEVTVLPANFTATTIGTDQYLVEMTLPSTITLPAGERSWVCVQPNNQFALNGQTGWMGEVGIGNGQECYCAFPLLGYDKWVTATWVLGYPIEAGFALLGTEGGYPDNIWDFEDGTMQGWVHTNGQAYPAGWDVIDAGTANWPPPNMGNYCLGIDDDAAGSGTSVVDTVISPIFYGFTADYLKWGIGYNYIGSDWVDVVIAYYDGGWNYDLVKHYTSDQGGYSYGVWDSVDVSGYSADEYQLMFIFNDGGVWAWWCEIDNIGPFLWWLCYDVASIAFLSPGALVVPGGTSVIGVVRNFGSHEETYDVHCVVTDPTCATVLDTMISVTTPSFENDTIYFGDIDCVFGYTYDIMMVTRLPGDWNPSNDTLFQVTNVTPCVWESWTSLPEGRSGAFVGNWDTNIGQYYVYCFGGSPGPMTSAVRYELNTYQWEPVPDLPAAANHGGNASIDGKMYMIGAWVGPADLMTIFDCQSEIYSTIILPTSITDPAIAVYQDNYIYSIGGSNPPSWEGSTIVMLYDVAADSFWTGVTQLPVESYVTRAVAGYIGNDTLIVSGGIDMVATPKTTMGAIDPVNPANVTWSTGIPHPGDPAYGCYGDVVVHDDDYAFIIVGGSPYDPHTHSYTSNFGWAVHPDKITPCYSSGAVACNWFASTSFLMTLGGYADSYLDVFEVLRWEWLPGIQEHPDDNIHVFDFSCTNSNPVKDQVRFSLSLPIQGAVRFQVFDIAGRQVIDSQYSSISQGKHTLFWNLRDEQGREIAVGTYFYNFTAGKYSATGKLIVLR